MAKDLAKNIINTAPNPIVLELHFNSCKKIAHGCEILIHEKTDNQSFKHCYLLADIISDNINDAFLIKQRHDNGVKYVKENDRGAYNLKTLHNEDIKVACLVEPCFANYATAEAKAIIQNPKKYAKVLLSSVYQYFAITNYLRSRLPINEIKKAVEKLSSLTKSIEDY
jgi:hypothetical protein